MGTEFDGGLVVLILVVIAVCLGLNMLTKPKAKTKEDFAVSPKGKARTKSDHRNSDDTAPVAAIMGADALMGGSDTHHTPKSNNQANDFGSISDSSSSSVSSGE